MAIINSATTQHKHHSLIPRDLLTRVLRHAPLRVQRVLAPDREHSLAVRWKYGQYDTRVVCIAEDQKFIRNCDRFDCVPPNRHYKALAFTRHHIYTDNKAFCASSGRLLQSIDRDQHISALDYTVHGFITGWRDGAVHFPGRRSHYPAEITVIHMSQGRVLVGSEDGQCHAWSPSGELQLSFPKGAASVTSIACSQEAVAISYADCATSLFAGSQPVATKRTEFIAFASCISDRTLFTGHEDGKVRIWCMDALRLAKSIQAGGVVSAVHVQEELLAVGLVCGRIELFDWQLGEPVGQFSDHRQMVTRVMVHGESIISSSLDGTIRSRSLCQLN